MPSSVAHFPIATVLSTMASIWKHAVSVESLTQIHRGTAPEYLGIEFLEVGDDFIRARIPVDERTRQPYGILHGGVSVVLAETLGSCGAACACPPGYRAVGLEVNANHLRSTTSGWVTGTARPLPASRFPRRRSSSSRCTSDELRMSGRSSY